MITVNSTLSYERQTVPPIIPAVQGDTGRNISFKINDTTIPEGATAAFYIQKPSGNAIYNTAEVISSNQILVPLDAQCLAEVGENFGQVRILLNGDVVTSFDFILLVKVFHGIDAIESLTELNVFDQAVANAVADIQTEAEQIAAEVIASIPEDYTELVDDVDDLKQDYSQLLNSAYVTETITDEAVASFSDGADGVPVKSLTVDVTPVQSGTGDPSPTNIRPISGWTGVNVTRTGKNLVDIQDYSNTTAQTIVSETSPKFASIPYKENTRYTISADVVIDSARAFGIVVIYTDNTSEYLWLSRFGTVQNHVITASGKTVSIIDFAYDAVQTVTSLTNVMLEEGTTASVYEPFGTVYSVNWQTEAGTVYGVTLDVVNGVLTVDRASVDLGTLDWSHIDDSNWNCFTSSSLTTLKAKGLENLLCSKYVYGVMYGTQTNNIMSGNGSNGVVYIRDTSYNDATSFKTSLSGVQLVYELATPVTYQLTPTEVTTLLLNNNIFADCGNINELTYRADLKAYIDSVIS